MTPKELDLPNSWSNLPLSEITKKKIVYGIVQAGPCVVDGIPYIKSTDVGGKISIDTLSKTSHEIHKKYKRSEVVPGDIVFSLRGNIGSASVVPSNIRRANLTQGTARISVKDEFCTDYVFYQLQNPYVASRINAVSKGSTFREISLEELRKIKIPCTPKLVEQKKIARILSTWDAAFETVEKLIENSRRQKKALMQQLLTGKKRLPGFSGEWKTYKLSSIAKVIVSNVDKKSKANERPVRLCNYTDVYYNDYITSKISFMEATASKAQIGKFTLRVGDILITKDSETPDDIAIPALVDEPLTNVLCGYHLAIVRPNECLADGAFLSGLFALPKTRYYFSCLANGATRFGLTVSALEDAAFRIPPIREQQAIARVFRAFSKEILNLEDQASLLKSEKTALMQQLLTGKRRVKVDE